MVWEKGNAALFEIVPSSWTFMVSFLADCDFRVSLLYIMIYLLLVNALGVSECRRISFASQELSFRIDTAPCNLYRVCRNAFFLHSF